MLMGVTRGWEGLGLELGLGLGVVKEWGWEGKRGSGTRVLWVISRIISTSLIKNKK
jgi:hypothetical protein